MAATNSVQTAAAKAFPVAMAMMTPPDVAPLTLGSSLGISQTVARLTKLSVKAGSAHVLTNFLGSSVKTLRSHLRT